jgi:hypothetical protein
VAVAVSASLSGEAPFMLCVHLGVPMCVSWCAQDKDLFREHYSLLLSRRLLQKKSVSDELEKFGKQQRQRQQHWCPMCPCFEIRVVD